MTKVYAPAIPLQDSFQNEPLSLSPEDRIEATVELPPAYENVPANLENPSYRLVPPILGATRSIFHQNIQRTMYPQYSEDANFLESMIKEQSTVPPNLVVRMLGTHVVKSDKITTITDFDFTVDMTSLVPFESKICNVSHIWEHRGAQPDPQSEVDVNYWCRKYTSTEAIAKKFTFTRKIVDYEQSETKLKELLTDLIQNTNYRGRIEIIFERENTSIIVIAPSSLNRLRENKWFTFFLVLTCLWILTWPLFELMTTHYHVLQAEFQVLAGFKEQAFESWKEDIKRAVLGKEKKSLDLEFRRRTAEILAGAAHLLPGTETDRIRYGVWGGDEV